LKTGVTVLPSGVLGLGKNDGPDTTRVEGFRVLDVEGVSTSGGADDTVADRGREIGALVGCGVGVVNGRDGAGGVNWGSGEGCAAFEAFAAASLA